MAPIGSLREIGNARDWQTSDMWKLRILIGDVLAGEKATLAQLGKHDKENLATITDAVLCYTLGKKPFRGHPLPDQWRDVFDFLQALLQKDPRARMTTREALDHAFLKNADPMTELLSSSSRR